MNWVLICMFAISSNKPPVVIKANSEAHCHQLAGMVKTIDGLTHTHCTQSMIQLPLEPSE